MKYYVTADIHGFYSEFRRALAEAGYDNERGPHRLIVLGDVFDRGSEANELQDFILRHMELEDLILVRGNHEDLFEDMVTVDRGRALYHHRSNGTFDTALQLTGYDPLVAKHEPWDFARAARETPFYRDILPAMVDYYETEHYVFVHGWLPEPEELYGGDALDWRSADSEAWRRARWMNGMDAAQRSRAEKTVLCGHWHCSYGHTRYEGHGSEFGPDADFSPYYGPGVIALDACTVFSGRVNVVVLED